SPISTRAAIEAMPDGCITVVDAMGVTDAGIFGDILCARMAKRGVAGLVTDGVVRDLAGVLGTGVPVWCQGEGAVPASPSPRPPGDPPSPPPPPGREPAPGPRPGGRRAAAGEGGATSTSVWCCGTPPPPGGPPLRPLPFGG